MTVAESCVEYFINCVKSEAFRFYLKFAYYAVLKPIILSLSLQPTVIIVKTHINKITNYYYAVREEELR